MSPEPLQVTMWTEGVCGDGAAILRDGKMVPISEVLRILNAAEDRNFECAARKQGTAGGNASADCDWPVCGCDVYAFKIVEALAGSGWSSPDELQAYARKTREQVLREVRAGSHCEDCP